MMIIITLVGTGEGAVGGGLGVATVDENEEEEEDGGGGREEAELTFNDELFELHYLTNMYHIVMHMYSL